MSTSENIILKLRPASGRAVDIAAALALAVTAAADQEAAVAVAKRSRDDALLDAEPSVLRKAETALADAREQAERINAVQANLRTRHAAAVETELMAALETSKQRLGGSYDAVNSWWIKERQELVKRFTKGVALSQAVSDAFCEMQALEREVKERYPDKRPAHFMPPAMMASDWPRELGRQLDWIHGYPEDVGRIATVCDPLPPGTL